MSQVARTLGTVVFGLIGGALGGPLGWAIGTLIGTALFTKKPAVNLDDAPRLQASKGAMFPLIYGGYFHELDEDGEELETFEKRGGVCVRDCIAIDCDPDGGVTRRTRKVTVGGGFFGLFQQKAEVQELYLTAAFAVADAVVAPVTIDLIYYGDEVIYNRYGEAGTTTTIDFHGVPITTTHPGTIGYDLTPELDADGNVIAETCDTLELYRGTRKQLPSPILEAIHGAGEVPAYRSIAYLVVKDFKIDGLKAFKVVCNNGITYIRHIVRTHLTLPELQTGQPILDPARVCLCYCDGRVRGAFQNEYGAPRVLAEQLARWAHCDLVEVDAMIRDSSRAEPTIADLTLDELAAHESSGDADFPPAYTISDVDELELPSSTIVGFHDIEQDWEASTGEYNQPTATHNNTQQVDMGIVAKKADAVSRAMIYHDEAHAARYAIDTAVPFSPHIRRIPGDVFRLPLPEGDLYQRVESQSLGGVILHKGHSWLSGSYTHQPTVQTDPRPDPAVDENTLDGFFMADVVNLVDDTVPTAGIVMAATGNNWQGARFNISNGLGDIYVPARADMGVSTTVLGAVSTTRFDYSVSVRLDMKNGAVPSSAPGTTILDKEAAVRGGANKLLLGERVLRWTLATLVSGTEYELTGLLQELGSEYEATSPIGTMAVIIADANGALSEGVQFLNITDTLIGTALSVQVFSTGRNGSQTASFTYTPAGNGLKCLAPVHCGTTPDVADRDASTDVTASCQIRTRYATANEKQSGTVPLSDPVLLDLELYDGVTLKHTLSDLTQSSVLLHAADLTDWFGAYPLSGFSGKWYHKNARMGRGFVGSFGTTDGTIVDSGDTGSDSELVGDIDGVNTVYTTAGSFVSGSTKVYLNGIRQKRGSSFDYTETAANQITFNSPPASGATIVVDYTPA